MNDRGAGGKLVPNDGRGLSRFQTAITWKNLSRSNPVFRTRHSPERITGYSYRAFYKQLGTRFFLGLMAWLQFVVSIIIRTAIPVLLLKDHLRVSTTALEREESGSCGPWRRLCTSRFTEDIFHLKVLIQPMPGKNAFDHRLRLQE